MPVIKCSNLHCSWPKMIYALTGASDPRLLKNPGNWTICDRGADTILKRSQISLQSSLYPRRVGNPVGLAISFNIPFLISSESESKKSARVSRPFLSSVFHASSAASLGAGGEMMLLVIDGAGWEAEVESSRCDAEVVCETGRSKSMKSPLMEGISTDAHRVDAIRL